jgi:hypothetical protein
MYLSLLFCCYFVVLMFCSCFVVIVVLFCVSLFLSVLALDYSHTSQFWATGEGTEKNTKILLPQGRGSNRNLPEYEVTTKLQPLVVRMNRIFSPRSWCSESRSLRDRHSPRQIKKMYPALLLPGRVDTREDIFYQNTCASAIIIEFWLISLHKL